jgi:hypothetical protein
MCVNWKLRWESLRWLHLCHKSDGPGLIDSPRQENPYCQDQLPLPDKLHRRLSTKDDNRDRLATIRRYTEQDHLNNLRIREKNDGSIRMKNTHKYANERGTDRPRRVKTQLSGFACLKPRYVRLVFHCISLVLVVSKSELPSGLPIPVMDCFNHLPIPMDTTNNVLAIMTLNLNGINSLTRVDMFHRFAQSNSIDILFLQKSSVRGSCTCLDMHYTVIWKRK